LSIPTSLATIRDGRLYRETHTNFEDYLQARWPALPGLTINSRQRAQQVIDAIDVMGVLSKIFDGPLPAKESQARELTPLRDQPDKMAQAWQRAVERSEYWPTNAPKSPPF
jgi:hypothetical protein